MIDLSNLLVGGGLCSAALYLLRLNDLRVGRHLPRCIRVQRAGLIASAWVMGGGPLVPQWAQLATAGLLVLLLIHILVTYADWAAGAPRDAETVPGELADEMSRR